MRNEKFSIKGFRDSWLTTATNTNRQIRSLDNLLWKKRFCKVENSLKLALLKLDEWPTSGGSSTAFIIFIKKTDPLAQTRNLGTPLITCPSPLTFSSHCPLCLKQLSLEPKPVSTLETFLLKLSFLKSVSSPLSLSGTIFICFHCSLSLFFKKKK